MTKIIKSKAEMQSFAEIFGKSLKNNDIILLKGNLGVGKTFFASSLINSLQKEKDNITSPTFNIVQHYQTIKGQVSHFDLYRIKDVSELANINFREIITTDICLIEWPEIIEDLLPNSIKINITVNNDNRILSIS
jgi:tRNA threonylcarbamoyladenosine biosynthesis protein TsaE